ncbi:rod shape-determining protein MreC [Telmatospirillum sp. J64-1]|uniref:rod shape-determining protein MreC n=1 Tax=Telmatospirillum sp. J64-1 TaxID=2502183 RepID=UPI00115EB376|nr:rod shape-determining protein MreC [Telmatospirillum sp. J64-1]
MKQHSGSPVGRLAHLRLLVQRFAFLALVGAAFGLMLLGKADMVLVERMRMSVADALAPVLDVMARPAAGIADIVENVHELANLRAENARLREENAKLLHWQTVARRLDAENRILAEKLNYLPDPEAAYITARVVADTGGTFVHSMLINAGARNGVRKGQAVMSGEVLVGRIASVGQTSARVLLLTDLNARVPVVIESSRVKAILSGDNSDRPRLSYLSGDPLAGPPSVAPGERIVTSGHGGAFPPGIPVGVVASVTDGVARVQPFIHRHELEFVTVVDYGLGAVLPGSNGAEDTRRGGSTS